jgi:hypothetical protein
MTLFCRSCSLWGKVEYDLVVQVLFSMWQHQELREVYRKSGWKETDFVTKTVAARQGFTQKRGK